jgi:serpin B
MVYSGAAGPTKQQIADAMHLGGTDEEIEAAFGGLVRAFADAGDDIELAVVDRLFGDRRVPFEPAWLARVDRAFGAPLEPVDFLGAPEAARVRINGWVAEQTRDKIRDLLPVGAVDPSTRLVLVNAIYFKAQWTEPFLEHATQQADFHGPRGPKQAQLMSHTGQLAYAEHPDDGVRVLGLPYASGEMRMIVILPDARDGLPDVEAKLDAAALRRWTSVSAHERVHVRLPRFRIEMPDPLELRAILESLGITRAFVHSQADFTPMAPASERLEISEGYHKAFIEVDEKGTEAAAATAFGMRVGGAPPTAEPKQFWADHPFLYVIRHEATGAILFIGRVTDPE